MDMALPTGNSDSHRVFANVLAMVHEVRIPKERAQDHLVHPENRPRAGAPFGGSCREVPSGASEVLQILLSCILSWVSRCDVPLLPSRCVKGKGQFRRLQGPLALRGSRFPFFL